MIILAMLWLTIGVFLLGMYNALLLKDDKMTEDNPKNKELEKEWHIIGASVFLYMSITAWFMFSFWYLPFALAMFWVLFGGIVHVIGLNKPFFFVGTTAWTDRILQKIFKEKAETGSAFFKITILLISILLIVFK